MLRPYVFGKGPLHPHFPATAQEGAVLLENAHGVLVPLGSGGVHQLA